MDVLWFVIICTLMEVIPTLCSYLFLFFVIDHMLISFFSMFIAFTRLGTSTPGCLFSLYFSLHLFSHFPRRGFAYTTAYPYTAALPTFTVGYPCVHHSTCNT
ncbi:hypothetical protein F5050DRAFT_1730304 [Lentinula boryana]|uniref:Uncharacterized protein n=1 Tax=Lentinula boryana TaxID=40481 RepID=A0ABQ8QPS9_9AGAR|nr:hypothetical protein F5050DRAFT_1730304 [Lentinula boryana]